MTPLEPLLRELVGEALRRRRRAQGRTLADVAAQAGMSMQHLSDVERGRKDPSSEILAAICGALEISLGRLLVLTAEPDDAHRGARPGSATATGRPAILELAGGPRSSSPAVAPDGAVSPSRAVSSGRAASPAREVMLSAA